jgi:hypothetical protein
MLKVLGLAGTAVGVAVLAAGSVAPATGNVNADRHGRGGDTVRVLSTNVEEAYVDADPVGEFSLGDAFIFSSDLTRHGKSVGHTGVVCTVTSVAREELQCAGTAWLRHGQIAIQGLVAGDPDVFEFPITGGTGRYEGAEGTLVVKEIRGSDPTQEILTFYLSD